MIIFRRAFAGIHGDAEALMDSRLSYRRNIIMFPPHKTHTEMPKLMYSRMKLQKHAFTAVFVIK